MTQNIGHMTRTAGRWTPSHHHPGPYPQGGIEQGRMACLLLSFPIMRVLIIDDDRLIGWVLQEICIQEGHEVSLVTDADRALHELESGPYDIVFADLETESVEARTIAGKLSLYQPGTSLILLSARSRPEFDFSINDVPFKGIIGKPFETATVRSWIETVQARIGERTGGSS